jgi:hypothetical protein
MVYYGKQIIQIVDLLAVEPDKVFHTITYNSLCYSDWTRLL